MSTATVESGPTEKLRAHLAEEQAAYAHGEDRPRASFGAVIAIYSAVVGVLAFVVRRSGRPFASQRRHRRRCSDLRGHALSRLFSKDPITSPLRAPFTRFEGTSGEAELAEEVRGQGARKAMGELLTCPFCVSQRVATGLVFGLVLAPRATRLFATLFTSLTAADLLQFGYDKVQQEVTG
jgi:hypothetical protein